MERLKVCAVPMCFSKSLIEGAEGDKMFFPVPKDPVIRKQWFFAMNRTTIPKNRQFYVCEDHFDLENDLVDHNTCYTGISDTVKLKPDVIPHLFNCQKDPSKTDNNRVTAGKQEMERFKRRLIRSVARLLIVEKKSEDEAWVELKKETGCNCRLLWSRMRALTIKKLERLLLFGDVIQSVPKKIRMTFTDWLLFDLILAHQDIDLINKDSVNDLKPAKDLFELVKKFRVNECEGDELVEAWSMLTVEYNKAGHQCSPMLLQRRWYQLRQATRDKFYNFWQSYRGVAKRLETAAVEQPTPLQTAIAAWDKSLITSPFVEWEELIKKRRVVMPDEFERLFKEKLRQTRPAKKQTNDDTPDLEVIEPRIETIDLRLDSDPEDEEETPDPDQSEAAPVDSGITIKEEPLDFPTDESSQEPKKNSIYDDVLIATTIDHDKLDDLENTDITTEVIDKDLDEVQPIEPMLPQIMNVFGNVEVNSENLSIISAFTEPNTAVDTAVQSMDDLSQGNIENNHPSALQNDILIQQIKPNIGYVEIISESSKKSPEEDSKPETLDISDEDMDDIIMQNEPNVIKNDPPSDDVIMIPENDSVEKIIKNEPSCDDVVMIPENDAVENVIKNEPTENLIPDMGHNDPIMDNQVAMGLNNPKMGTSETVLHENNIVEDKDKYIENMINLSLGKLIKETIIEREEVNASPRNMTFSFGELPKDINFADEGIEFLDDGIAYCEEDESERETITIKTEIDEEEDEEDKTAIICKKLEMIAIVYTTKLEDMGIFRSYSSFEHVGNKGLIDMIASKSKPVLPQQEELTKEKTENLEKIVKVEKVENIENLEKIVKVEKFENIENLEKNVKVENLENLEYTEEPVIDNEDSDEDIVTDKQRVKLSSHLLQKPRSRVYTPIQLCKNPDFNTRLKRLTVGFLMSPRNRSLLKTLKPLTIDLSKTFENKLVAGTLYLKDGDKAIKEEVKPIDDSCHNASVVPSAMPAQSLIDHSGDILPILKQAMASSKPVEEPNVSNERSKVINLPDISEIRRINQKLLTAEVTPIQMNTVKPYAPVSLVGTPVSEENKAPSVQETVEKNSDLGLTVNSGTVNVRPVLNDNLVNIPDTSQPSHCSSSYPFNRLYNNPDPTPSQAGQAPPVRGQTSSRGQAKRGRGAFFGAPWKSRDSRPQIPWFKNVDNNPLKNDDYLLTVDTLDKMLYVLNKEESLKGTAKPKKKKKKSKKEKEEEVSEVHVIDDDKSNDEVQVVEAGPLGTSPKPKLTVFAADNYPNKNTMSTNKVLESLKNKYENKTSFCCWARHRMCRMVYSKKPLPPHECPYPNCLCCCKSLLAQFLANEEKLKATRMRRKMNTATSKAVESIIPNSIENSNVKLIEVSRLRRISDTEDENLSASVSTATNNVAEQNSIIVDAEIPSTDIATPSEIDNTSQSIVERRTTLKNGSQVKTPFKVYGTPVTVLELPETGQTTLIEIPSTEYGQTSVLDGSSAVIDTQDLTEEDDIANTTQALDKVVDSSITTTHVIAPMMVDPDIHALTPVVVDPPSQPLTPVMVNASTQALYPVVDKPDTEVLAPTVVNTDTTAESVPVVDITKEQSDENQPIEIDDRSPDTVSLSDNEVPNDNVVPEAVSVCSESPAMQELPVRRSSRKRNVPVSCVKDSQFPMLTVRPDLETEPAAPVVDRSNVNQSGMTLRNLVNNRKRKMPIPRGITPKPEQLQTLKSYKPPAHFKEKMIYLNSKQISEKPSNNPIFLGKNKILLTTVKFPPNLKTFEMVKRKILPQLQLPVGVQIVLLPNCQVTCVYDSNVNLTPEEKNSLPGIIKAVQDKINAMSSVSNVSAPNVNPVPPVVDSEIVNLDDDDDIPLAANNPAANIAPEVNTSVSNDNVPNTNNETQITEDTNKSVDNQLMTENRENLKNEENITKVPENTETIQNETVRAVEVTDSVNTPTAVVDEVKQLNTTQNVEKPVSDEIVKNNDNVTTIVDESSTKQSTEVTEDHNKLEETPTKPINVNKTKNILSDLMEMSGISEEDMTPTPEEIPQVPPQIPQLPPDVSQLAGQSQPITVRPLNMPPKIGELSPITSLIELKFACQNGGAFFKLDFDTGYLVPINVCMKQTVKPKVNLLNATKSVIDLTEEDEPATSTQTSPNEPTFSVNTQISPNRSLLKDSVIPEKVKPVKLFKSHPTILKRYSKTGAVSYHIKKNRLPESEELTDLAVDVENMLPTPSKLYKGIVFKTADTVQTEKAQLVEGEQNKEIEMPLASETEPQPITVLTDSQVTTPIPLANDQIASVNNDSDDSDDEPLSTIAKRNRQERLAPINAIEVELNDDDDAPKSQEEAMDIDDCGVFLDQGDLDDNDSAEENCILGV